MKNLSLILAVLLSLPNLVLGGEKDTIYLTETMLPLAKEFVRRIGQTNEIPTTTNQVKKYKVDYFDDRPGCMANLRLTNDCSLSFHTETNKTEVWVFRRHIRTYYGLPPDAPKEKVDAIKALNLKNKLTKDDALKLAEKYFVQIGHKPDNFHPPEITQCYWSGVPGGKLPYFEITWYRKDVDVANLAKNGNTDFKAVIIEVSGIDSRLISYTKAGMPVGSDF